MVSALCETCQRPKRTRCQGGYYTGYPDGSEAVCPQYNEWLNDPRDDAEQRADFSTAEGQ